MGDAAARVAGAPVASAALDRFFESFYRRRPVTATFTGVHAHDGRLPNWSPLGLAGEADEMRALRAELAAAGAPAASALPSFPGGVDLALADAHLEIALAEHDSGHFVHRNPSVWTGEAIFGVVSLVTRDFAPIEDRLEAAHRRLEAIPRFLADLRTTLTEAPLDWKGRAKRECQAATQLFGETLPAWMATQTSAPKPDWAAAGSKAARAFQELDTWLGAVGQAGPLAWLRSSVATAPSARESAGVDLLALLLARGHFVTSPIDDLLREAHRCARRGDGAPRRDVASSRRLACRPGTAGRRSRPRR